MGTTHLIRIITKIEEKYKKLTVIKTRDSGIEVLRSCLQLLQVFSNESKRPGIEIEIGFAKDRDTRITDIPYPYITTCAVTAIANPNPPYPAFFEAIERHSDEEGFDITVIDITQKTPQYCFTLAIDGLALNAQEYMSKHQIESNDLISLCSFQTISNDTLQYSKKDRNRIMKRVKLSIDYNDQDLSEHDRERICRDLDMNTSRNFDLSRERLKYQDLQNLMSNRPIDTLYLLGQDTISVEDLAQFLRKHEPKIPNVYHFELMRQPFLKEPSISSFDSLSPLTSLKRLIIIDNNLKARSKKPKECPKCDSHLYSVRIGITIKAYSMTESMLSNEQILSSLNRLINTDLKAYPTVQVVAKSFAAPPDCNQPIGPLISSLYHAYPNRYPSHEPVNMSPLKSDEWALVLLSEGWGLSTSYLKKYYSLITPSAKQPNLFDILDVPEWAGEKLDSTWQNSVSSNSIPLYNNADYISTYINVLQDKSEGQGEMDILMTSEELELAKKKV